MNPLLQKFDTSYETAPFSKIEERHFLPAFKELIQQAEQEILSIAQNPDSPTFENTIEALAYSGERLDQVSHIFFNLNSAETNDTLQAIAQEVSPLLTEFSSQISQNTELFHRVQAVYNRKEELNLNQEQKTLLEDSYKSFVRNGALLQEEDKKKLEQMNIQLATKSLQFGQNVLAATNAYFKHIEHQEALRGIPESVLQQYAEEAQKRDLKGFVVTLQYPSYIPLMTYAENRELREEISLANGTKCFDGGAYDNQTLIKEIVKLRHQKARLLGYTTFAEYVLEERMAKNSKTVFDFLHELLQKARPFAEKEIEALRNLAKKEGISHLESYDHAYFAEKLRKEKFDLTDEELKPYFSLEKVEQAVFHLAEKLFGLHFREVDTIDTYHPEVRTYEVYQAENQLKAILYTDYHPRAGKRAGAWMTSFKNQYIRHGENHRPHISVVCNFSKPTENTPSLLTFQEVTTLFHEFGHAIHGILADTQYPTLSGTSVKWDFVELPSQFLENYCYEPEFLKSFAKHYQNGETLSDDKIEKISASKNFMEGYQTLRQLGFGLLDMAYHSYPDQLTDIQAFEEQYTAHTRLYPSHHHTAFSPSFSHIFQGGYSAGYYSYKWAEVLDADAFQLFKEKGLYHPETAKCYAYLLSQGGTQDPMELYKGFRGREPNIESLLKRAFGEN